MCGHLFTVRSRDGAGRETSSPVGVGVLLRGRQRVDGMCGLRRRHILGEGFPTLASISCTELKLSISTLARHHK